jgi:hypothetical protein
MAGWARMGEKSDAYKILVGTPEGKRLLGSPKNVRIILKRIFNL